MFFSFPPLASLFSSVDFEVFYLKFGYLFENSWISLNSTRTLNSWLAISVLMALTSAGCLAISASQFASCNTRMSAFSSLSLGHCCRRESNIFHLVYSTYHQPFQKLSGFEAVSKAQRLCRDRLNKASLPLIYSLLEGESGYRDPLLHCLHQSSQVPEPESIHGGAPRSCTNLLPLHHLASFHPTHFVICGFTTLNCHYVDCVVVPMHSPSTDLESS